MTISKQDQIAVHNAFVRSDDDGTDILLEAVAKAVGTFWRGVTAADITVR
jgi:hypothetical protein